MAIYSLTWFLSSPDPLICNLKTLGLSKKNLSRYTLLLDTLDTQLINTIKTKGT